MNRIRPIASSAGKLAAAVLAATIAVVLPTASLPSRALAHPAPAAAEAPASEVHHVCPMGHFEGDRAGACPKCGMKLVAKKVAAVPAKGASGSHEYKDVDARGAMATGSHMCKEMAAGHRCKEMAAGHKCKEMMSGRQCKEMEGASGPAGTDTPAASGSSSRHH